MKNIVRFGVQDRAISPVHVKQQVWSRPTFFQRLPILAVLEPSSFRMCCRDQLTGHGQGNEGEDVLYNGKPGCFGIQSVIKCWRCLKKEAFRGCQRLLLSTFCSMLQNCAFLSFCSVSINALHWRKSSRCAVLEERWTDQTVFRRSCSTFLPLMPRAGNTWRICCLTGCSSRGPATIACPRIGRHVWS